MPSRKSFERGSSVFLSCPLRKSIWQHCYASDFCSCPQRRAQIHLICFSNKIARFSIAAIPLEECEAVPVERQTEVTATLCMKPSGTQARSVSQSRNCPPFAELCAGGRQAAQDATTGLPPMFRMLFRPAAARRLCSGCFELGCDQLQSVKQHRLYSGCSDIDSQEYEQDPNRKCLSRQNIQYVGIPNRDRSLETARAG